MTDHLSIEAILARTAPLLTDLAGIPGVILLDETGARIKALITPLGQGRWGRSAHQHLPFGGLSLEGSAAITLTQLREPAILGFSDRNSQDRLFSESAPLNFMVRCPRQYCLPLRFRQFNLGVLIIPLRRPQDPHRKEVALCQLLAGQLAMAEALTLIEGQAGGNSSFAGQRMEAEGDRRPLEKEMVGTSPAISMVFHLVSQVAPSDSTVLLQGETGTGKELVARAIHSHSHRRDKILVKVNCAALPAGLIESELFGHEKGSFTGATERRIGKFELAGQGTLFLDEVGELPPDLQVKLLRALQEKEIERIGGNGVIRVDVRVIAATNRDLEKEVRQGRFRSDLFYRLNVFPITLPALRDRKEDIPALAAHFVEKYARKTGRNIGPLPRRVLETLSAYPWPGNVRELEHLVERSVVLAKGNIIREIDLPGQELRAPGGRAENRVKTIDEVERDHILAVLKRCRGKISGDGGAAQLLHIPSTTLNSKIKRLGIKKGFRHQ